MKPQRNEIFNYFYFIILIKCLLRFVWCMNKILFNFVYVCQYLQTAKSPRVRCLFEFSFRALIFSRFISFQICFYIQILWIGNVCMTNYIKHIQFVQFLLLLRFEFGIQPLKSCSIFIIDVFIISSFFCETAIPFRKRKRSWMALKLTHFSYFIAYMNLSRPKWNEV